MAVSKTRSDSADYRQGRKSSPAANPATSSTISPIGIKSRSGSETRKRGPKINFRVSESGLAKIQAAAERAGLTVGSYVRSRALRNPTTRAVRRPPLATAQLAQLLGLLGAAGGELQRIASRLAGGEAPKGTDIDAALTEFRAAAASIQQALGKRL
jgi:uncharacterized protein (DUF1778 family)